MITKRQTAALVTFILEGGEVTSQRIPDPREIFIVVDMAMHELMYRDIKRNNEVDGRFYSPPKVLAVSFDQTRNKKFTDLPAAPIIGQDGTSLIIISPVQGDAISFIYKRALSNFLRAGTEAERMEGHVSFILENKKILFDNLPPQYAQVLVKQVSSISDLDEDAAIPIPDHLELQMLQNVLKIFGVQQSQAEIKKQMENVPQS